jgi:hypothetical protein
VHLLTGAPALGIEIQPELVAAGRALTERLHLGAVTFTCGDAARFAAVLAEGSVFFLYCPFGGERLRQVLSALETAARARVIRVGCLDLSLRAVPWLALASPGWPDLAIYRGAPP